MKTILTSFAAGSLLAAFAIAADPPRYTVIDLGPVGNPFSQATWLNDSGLATGFYTAADGTSHAAVWSDGALTDISKPGLGGPNSGAFGINAFGQIGGAAETSRPDPNNENYCGYGTGLQCLAFVFGPGGMRPLQPLGGTNSTFGAINNLGEVAGTAETNRRDLACPGTVAVNGTGPQLFDFEPVIWTSRSGQVRALSLPSGDTVGSAEGINDSGQAVGLSGTCANTVLPGFCAGPHAVMWDSDGTPHDLGNLGGTVNTSLLGVGNVAFAINNLGQVAGQSVLPGNQTFHPFLWTKASGMKDLGVLPGDLVGAGLSLNNNGDVVGASVSAPGPASGNPRAFLWSNGVMNDLNDLVQGNAPLYLLTAFAITDSGFISGFGVTGAGEIHGFMATPCYSRACRAQEVSGNSRKIAPPAPGTLSDDARKMLFQHPRAAGR
jgi:probable HAF family extracellular repeat protein